MEVKKGRKKLSSKRSFEVLLVCPKRLLRVNRSITLTAQIVGGTPDVHECTFLWKADDGKIVRNASGNEASYTAPNRKCTVEVSVEVKDKNNAVATQTVSIIIYKQVGFLKADDMRFHRESTIDPNWQKFLDYMTERQIKVCIGLICNSLEVGNADYFERLKRIEALDHFELFNHGYDHVLHLVNEQGELYNEFSNTSLAHQKEHLTKSQTLAKEKLGLTLHTFGAPGNKIDNNTTIAMESIADLKVWFLGDPSSSKMVLDKKRWIETTTGHPDYEVFVQSYGTEDDYMVLHLHPRAWDSENFAEYVKILDFLIDREMSFFLPYEYYKLTGTFHDTAVESIVDKGTPITVAPADINDKSSGNTNFIRTYEKGTRVTLTAPGKYKGKDFGRWLLDGVGSSRKTIEFKVEGNHTAAVFYGATIPPEIALSRSSFNFGGDKNGHHTPSQVMRIENRGGNILNWTAACESSWITIEPSSGTGAAVVSISAKTGNLGPGTYYGNFTVTDPIALNSPQTAVVTLNVFNTGGSPFGDFSTPGDGAAVSGSIPVTGWVLDDIGVEHVNIFCGQTYIGDAVFSEGARPDIETVYPDYPQNYRAGWGYMLLTNCLPGGGNGVYTLNVFAVDVEGNRVKLGSKTITVDNKNAVKPFGAIDTPVQGGTASGNKFVNWGWALTPMPNAIPKDGSTIHVFVDGVDLGSPVYNIPRPDIAGLFPGYANSDRATGYFELDTTAYKNGIHTIAWVVTDNAGNAEGIGSRYFIVNN